MDYSSFDTRKYPVVPVTEGYKEWANTYEQTVHDEMDMKLLSRISRIPWTEVDKAVDLACGTGRIGVWLNHQGVKHIDGIDITPEMLSKAKEKNVYESLLNADILHTPLASASYDLCIQVLADEHLPDISLLYSEVSRLLKKNGRFIIVGYHPFFLMNGLITHFHNESGEPLAIESYVHLFSDHFKAARQYKLALVEMDEGIIDDGWLAKKSKWIKYKNWPVSFVFVWQKG